MKIIYQGEPGCFSDIAAKKILGEDIERVGVKTFEEVMISVVNSKDDMGILPVENTLIGKISQNFDLLLKNQVSVIGEVKMKVSFNLMALPGTEPDKIEEVWSHPAALEQCKNHILEKGYKPVAIYDTAGGAKLLKKKNIAILADSSVGEKYGLKTIAERIEDNNENYTRFFIISNKRRRLNIGNKVKTSIVFGVKNVPGILFKCLSVFALRNINLCSIESRPVPGKPWEYLFFIDFEGNIRDEKCEKAIEGLRETVRFLRILGSYKSSEV